MAKEKERIFTTEEKMVGVSFNPSGNLQVDIIKEQSARLIKFIRLCPCDDSFQEMSYDRAIEDIITACMWAVKGITKV